MGNQGCGQVQIEGITDTFMRRTTQFRIALLCSIIVSVLLISQIFLIRSLNREQALLTDSQETISTGPTYENLWKQLALHIYQAGPQDPALMGVLKTEKIVIHSNDTHDTNSGAPSAAPSPSSKTPDGSYAAPAP